MDPFSLTVGVAGLISLAIEASHLSRDIGEGIKSSNRMSKEYRRLERTLAQVSEMCTKIQLILNTLDQESARAYEKEIVEGIETSLRVCVGVLQRIQGEVSRVGSLSRSQRVAEALSGQLRKKMFDDAQEELGSCLGNVRDFILVHTWCMAIQPSQSHPSCCETKPGIKSPHEASPNLVGFSPVQCKASPNTVTRQQVEQKVVFLWKSVMEIYRTTTKKRWQIADDKDWQVVQERHELQLYLTIIPYRLNLEFGNPHTFTCNVTHIIPKHLLIEYREAVSRSDLSHIQYLLSSGALSLYSETQWGASLLHLAAEEGNVPICDFISKLDSTGKVWSLKGQRYLVGLGSRGNGIFSFYIANQHRISSLSDWWFVLDMAYTPDELAILCKALDSFDKDELPTYLYLAWRNGIFKYAVQSSGFQRPSSLRAAFADVFKLITRYGHFSNTILHPDSTLSIYLALYRHRNSKYFAYLDQFEFAEAFQEWLSIIESCGLDRQTYLEYLMPQFTRCTEDWKLLNNTNSARLQQSIQVRYGSVMGPGWTWWVDPDSPAGLVLQEFQCFDVATTPFSYPSPGRWGWKAFAPRESDGVIWQTYLDYWEDYFLARRGDLGPGNDDECPDGLREAVQLRCARFARRQAMKDRKAGRTGKLWKMPGSWVD